MYRYYVTEDCNDEQLLKYWDDVCQSIKNVSFVQKNEWFDAYLKSNFKNSYYFCFITFLLDGKPVAIVPLQYLITSRFGFSLKTWRIFWPHDLGINDLVFDPAAENQNIIVHLIKYLNTRRDLPWDLLVLQNCAQGGAVDLTMSQNRPFRSVTVLDHYSKYLLCESNVDNSVEKLSSKFKRNIRRLRKKLCEKGELTTHLYKEPGQLGDAFNEFLEVESSGWKDDSKTSLKHDKAQRSFYQSILKTFGQDGSCVIHTMKLDGRPIASQFAIISGDSYNMLKIGYDEEFKSMGPGALLLDDTVRVFSNDEIINSISFVTGGSWSDKWSPQTLYVKNHYIYNGTIKGNLCFFLEKNKDYLRSVKRYINLKRQQ